LYSQVVENDLGFPTALLEESTPMRHVLMPLLILLLLSAGCATQPLPPVAVKVPTRAISYQREVKPILTRRCTVCHSCYNSPCQLKMDSFDGVDRGASKRAVYNATRLKSMEPTRLFTDAKTTAQWRTKEFFSVTESSVADGYNDSIMIQLLAHKLKNPQSKGTYRAEADDLTCAENRGEVSAYLEKHPNYGMPFGFPPLKQEEFDTVAGWLLQGAKGPDAAEQLLLEIPLPGDAAQIARWEAFLNRDDPKHAVTARYLYEHLFLAHIRFAASGSNEFYELVRSRTPAGTPIDLVATVRPYDNPGTGRIYYRFRKIHSTIVQKTHMVFDLDDTVLARIEELFIKPEWLQPPHAVGYDPVLSSNPFKAFEQIPPRSRYQFLLDNAHYIIMTFIHGPVCRGQIALNVIEDHFWVIFMDPDHDLAVKYPGFLKMHGGKLRMPIEDGSDHKIFSALTDEHRKWAVDFYRARQDLYTALNYGGLDRKYIWRGNRAADAPLLTIYRHFDSASVHKGALGDLPRTVWVIDYPLLERIYYALVAGFDVYGTAGHQLAIRLYMDQLRVEGESYFLDFLPRSMRSNIMQSWYEKVDLNKIDFTPSTLPAAIRFTTADPKRELVEGLIDSHFLREAGISYDPVNYLRAGEEHPPLPGKYDTTADIMQAFRAISRPGIPFVSTVNNHDANLAYIRIRMTSGRDLAGTFIINRWHDNVAMLYNEEKWLNPSRDSLEFKPGLLGSYPNYFFDVRQEELADFFDMIVNFTTSPKDMARLGKYGINRGDDRFWGAYDWFQKRFDEDEPVRGGLFDLNRYFSEAP
jgi:hypothetical protein